VGEGEKGGGREVPNILTTDRISGGILLLVALAVAWEGRRLPIGTHHGPGPGYFPLILAGVLAVLALVIIARGRLTPPLATLGWVELPRAVAVAAAAAFAALALERLGYRLTVILVLAILLGVVERRPPWLVALVTAGAAFGSFWLFHTVLRVPLPRGPFGF
jgi:putative tricarboxylic transport membrane protein